WKLGQPSQLKRLEAPSCSPQDATSQFSRFHRLQIDLHIWISALWGQTFCFSFSMGLSVVQEAYRNMTSSAQQAAVVIGAGWQCPDKDCLREYTQYASATKCNGGSAARLNHCDDSICSFGLG